jgi:TolA-binding protein
MFGIITRLIGCVLGNPSAEQLEAENLNQGLSRTITQKNMEIGKLKKNKDKEKELNDRESKLNYRERQLDKRQEEMNEQEKQNEIDFENRFNDADITSRQDDNIKKCKVCNKKPCICDDDDNNNDKPWKPIKPRTGEAGKSLGKAVVKTGLDMII